MPRKRKHVTSEIIKEFSSQLSGFVIGRVNRHEDAQDVIQDVWYQLSRLTNLDELENISAWLYRVARNKITDLYRKKSDVLLEDYTYETEEDEVEIRDILLLDTTNDPELTLFKQIFWDALLKALNELPEKQRQVFILNEIEGVTLQEIATTQQENIKTIISRKTYAVKHLRKRLLNLYNDLN
ncbi:sigma-70 family RNA polymerase sigma factor [Flavobacterium arcticum]|uniref:Sigma-70 family RNA polymerase sigma factor n=1 Tax=Flavobacterium arcticum TaxID=1784713 RepID=A0A345H923_9FLAO|nr:sigma-70 family RNA polymerase sigma factor [Flavobacterium arcticum]AXG73083.1 sigma-70 family RNA polymerase sigma factor [Flavobacterium arcticum]KAF2512874.1 sigma-70 family RNA polymerase sigma factor [Flavobacterium arcticum]